MVTTFIDVHTHLGSNKNMTARVDELLRSMDAAEIERSLVFAGSINGISNQDLITEIAPYRDRLHPVLAAELVALNVQDLIRYMDSCEPIAVKFYLGYEHIYPDAPIVYDIMREIQSRDLTAIFHTGDCYRCIKNAKLKYAHPLGIDDVATDFPDTRIVIAHAGYPWHRDAAEVCYKNSNVFVDISGFVYGSFDDASKENFKRMIDEFRFIAGSKDEQILFGSDWPISDQSSYVQVAYELFDMMTLDTNARRAFRLP